MAIYLSDHLSGATGAVNRLSMMADGYTDLSIHGDLQTLCEDVKHDRQALTDIMDRLGVRAQRHKVVAGQVGEALGRLKLNGRLRTRSPLTPVIELEVIQAGVTGKRSLWQTLGTHAEALGLDGGHLAELGDRASAQLQVLDRCHQQLAPGAFSE